MRTCYELCTVKVAFSSTSVDLTFSSLYATILLSFDISRIMSHQSEVLQDWSCLDIVILNGLSHCGDNWLSLASETTTMHPDVDIEEARVLSNHERQKNSVTLACKSEVVKHILSIDIDSTLAWLHTNNWVRGLALTETPWCTAWIELSLTVFLR